MPNLKGATRDLRASTKRNYEDALWPVRERLGTRPLQSIIKSDVEDLVDWILTAGRRRAASRGLAYLAGRPGSRWDGSAPRWMQPSWKASSSAT